MRSKQEILEFHKANAERNGYYLTPDKELLDDLIGGLAANEERYGYGSGFGEGWGAGSGSGSGEVYGDGSGDG